MKNRKMIKRNLFYFFALAIIMLFTACNNDKQGGKQHVYYVDYLTDNDTLRDLLTNATSGKAAYYDINNNIEIVSLNYMQEKHKNTHYFKTTGEIPLKPEPNSIKYEVAFKGNFTNDSTFYSLKKYIYKKDKWETLSDMGFIKAYEYVSERDKTIPVNKRQLAQIIIKILVQDTYNK